MTCIAGISQGGKVWLGADSAGVCLEDLSLQVRGDAKVFKKDEFLYGFCGSFRARDVVQYGFQPTPQVSKQSDNEYLATTFVHELRQELLESGMSKIDDNLLELESSFLLGYRGKLYSVESDFQIGHNRVGFNATGCGYAYAMGSLDATRKLGNPPTRIRRALECAERWSAGVRAPFKLVSM